VPAFIKNMILSLSVNTICATQLALASRTDTTAFLNKISVPALIIRGKHDLLMEMEQAEVLKSNLRAGEFVEIPDSAHLPNLENPLLFNRELNLFLQRHFPA
jgi:pimeloyl-ACP methyl ester carboxylesterase